MESGRSVSAVYPGSSITSIYAVLGATAFEEMVLIDGADLVVHHGKHIQLFTGHLGQ